MRLFSVHGVPHAVALAMVLAGALALRLAWRKLFVRGREPGAMDRWLAEYTGTPVFLLIVAVGAEVIFGRLAELPEVRGLALTPYIGGATYIFTVLATTWVAYGAARGVCQWYVARFAQKTGTAVGHELVPALDLVVKVVLIFVAVTVVLGHYNVELKALLGAAGIASVILAFAAQDTVSNVMAGLTIMVDRPFRLGDRVELSNGRVGDVQEIGLRSTRILSPDNTVYIVPNSEIAKSGILNYSYPDEKLKVRQQLSVPYGCDIAMVKRLLLDACRAHPLVLPDPPPQAALSRLGDASLQISFSFWVQNFRMQGRALDEINTAVYLQLEREGIRLAPPKEVLLTGSQDLAPR